MAIKLETEEYCNACRNFEPESIKRSDNLDIVVQCIHRQQCKFLAQYLYKKIKYGGAGQNE